LGNQKNHMSLYLSAVYADKRMRAELEAAYARAEYTLDSGVGCIRFRKLGHLLLDVIADLVRRVEVDAFIRMVERARATVDEEKARQSGRS
jgi:hypothetical protein